VVATEIEVVVAVEVVVATDVMVATEVDVATEVIVTLCVVSDDVGVVIVRLVEVGLDVTVLSWVDDVVGVTVDWVLENVEFAVCSIEIVSGKFAPLFGVSQRWAIVAWARFDALSTERKVTESRMNIATFCE